MSTTIDRTSETAVRGVRTENEETLTKALLVAGILSSVIYGVMMLAFRYDGYSVTSQTVSELSAWGVSTRPLWVALGAVYTVLVVAFGIGVLRSAGDRRRLRTLGGLLIAYGILGVAWPLAAMHQREVLAAGGATLADTAHLALAGTSVLLMFSAMVVGAIAFRGWFRVYSVVTILALLAFGALTASVAPRVQANLPTPGIGVWERINIGVFLLWVVVVAVMLLRSRAPRADRRT